MNKKMKKINYKKKVKKNYNNIIKFNITIILS